MYRERGLGKWLKAEMLKYAKRTFLELKFVVTDFAVTNAPMIAINKKLGFKKVKSGPYVRSSYLADSF